MIMRVNLFFFFSSRRRHTRYWRDWSSDVCSSDLENTRNQKNIQQLTKDENGLYQFVYVADQKKIDDLEDQLKKKQEENTKWQDDLEDKKKRKKLEDEKKYEEDLIKQKQEYHNIEKNKLDEHYSNMDALTKNYMNDLKS